MANCEQLIFSTLANMLLLFTSFLDDYIQYYLLENTSKFLIVSVLFLKDGSCFDPSFPLSYKQGLTVITNLIWQ